MKGILAFKVMTVFLCCPSAHSSYTANLLKEFAVHVL